VPFLVVAFFDPRKARLDARKFASEQPAAAVNKRFAVHAQDQRMDKPQNGRRPIILSAIRLS
jgi:hypothetical protein